MSNDQKLEINFDRWWNTEALKHIAGLDEKLAAAIKQVAYTSWMNGAYIQSVLLEDDYEPEETDGSTMAQRQGD